METETTEAETAGPAAPKLRPFARICEILEKHQRSPARLIPILQAVQDEYRYLPEEVLTFVATSLGLPPARVYGVATFYSHFTLKPRGKYTIRLCDGTACHVRNSLPILEALYKRRKEAAQSSKRPAAPCGDEFACDRTAAATSIVCADGIGTGNRASIAARMCASRLLELLAEDSDVTELCTFLQLADRVNLFLGGAQNRAHGDITFRQQGILTRDRILPLIADKLRLAGKLVVMERV